MKRMGMLLSLLTFAACGKDSSGPSSPVLAGNWVYNISNLSGAGLSCSTFGTALRITQQGDSFTGTYSGGTISCLGFGSAPIGTGTVVNGSTTIAQTVSFDMDTQDWHNSGTVTGNSMSGNVRVVLSDGIDTFVLNGRFAASRP